MCALQKIYNNINNKKIQDTQHHVPVFSQNTTNQKKKTKNQTNNNKNCFCVYKIKQHGILFLIDFLMHKRFCFFFYFLFLSYTHKIFVCFFFADGK